MRDALGRTARIGDFVAIAARAGNSAEFKFGILHEIDQDKKRFKIERKNGSISNWMQWYYYDHESDDYCKVLVVHE